MTRTTITTLATAALIALGGSFTTSAQAYVPKRGEAKASVVDVLKDKQVAQSVFGFEANDIRYPLVKDAEGFIWKGQTLKRVKGGYNVAVIYRGHDANGDVRAVCGNVQVRSFKSGFSTTFRPVGS